jgi:hypothetical protein
MPLDVPKLGPILTWFVLLDELKAMTEQWRVEDEARSPTPIATTAKQTLDEAAEEDDGEGADDRGSPAERDPQRHDCGDRN